MSRRSVQSNQTRRPRRPGQRTRTGIETPTVQNGFVKAHEARGLSVELKGDAVRLHLRRGEERFAPALEWDEARSWDRIWS